MSIVRSASNGSAAHGQAQHAGVGGERPPVGELRRIVVDEEVDRSEADQRTDVRRVEAVLGGDLCGAAECPNGVGRVGITITAADDLQRGAQLVGTPVGLGRETALAASAAAWIGLPAPKAASAAIARAATSSGRWARSTNAPRPSIARPRALPGPEPGATRRARRQRAARARLAELGGLTGVTSQGQDTHPIGQHASEGRIENHRPRQVFVGGPQRAGGSGSPGEASQQSSRSAVVATQFVEISSEERHHHRGPAPRPPTQARAARTA